MAETLGQMLERVREQHEERTVRREQYKQQRAQQDRDDAADAIELARLRELHDGVAYALGSLMVNGTADCPWVRIEWGGLRRVFRRFFEPGGRYIARFEPQSGQPPLTAILFPYSGQILRVVGAQMTTIPPEPGSTVVVPRWIQRVHGSYPAAAPGDGALELELAIGHGLGHCVAELPDDQRTEAAKVIQQQMAYIFETPAQDQAQPAQP